MNSWPVLLVLIASLSLLASGCQDSGSGGDDDDTYGEDDDDLAGDDDDMSSDDDAVGDDDDAVGDDDDAVGDDDDAVGDDDDAVGDDDDTVGDDDVDTSCNRWDPIDLQSASWTYSSSYHFYYDGQEVDDTGTETVSPGGATTFEGHNVEQRVGTFTGTQVTMNWTGYDQCGIEGNVDYGSYLTDAGGNGSVTTTNDIGVLYLPYDPDTMIGHTWNTNYTQTVAMEGGGESDTTPYNVNWHWEVVGMESVTVPAGTYNAVHIHADYTSEDQIGEHGGTLDTYFVDGLGLIKWDEQRPNENGQYILRELESYSGPLSP